MKSIFLSGEVGYDITLASVRQLVEGAEGDELTVNINTPGGSVDEGFAIYDYLRSLDKQVTTIAEGGVYSIGTVIFLAGDKRIMRPNARLMIHNPWTQAVGDASDFVKMAEQLKQVEGQIVQFYQQKTGQNASKLFALMAEETYLNADQALDLGFATQIEEKNKIKSQIKNMASLTERIRNLVGLGELAAEVQNMAYQLEDGTAIYVFTEDDDLAGKSVVLADEEGNPTETAAPDGVHVLSDGRTIVVEGGIIAQVMEVETETETENGMREEMENLKAELAAKSKEIEEMRAKYDEREKNLENLVGAVEAMAKKIETAYVPPKPKTILAKVEKQEEEKPLRAIDALRKLKTLKQK